MCKIPLCSPHYHELQVGGYAGGSTEQRKKEANEIVCVCVWREKKNGGVELKGRCERNIGMAPRKNASEDAEEG